MGEIIQQRLKQSKFTTSQQEAVLSLLVAASHLRAKFDKVGSQFGISHEQYNILRILRGVYPEGHTCGAIGERMVDRAPDITRRIDGLERLGLVERTRGVEDRRVVITKITQSGIDLLSRMTANLDAMYENFGGELSDTDWMELTRLCETLFSEELVKA
jgi:DNA-binding MarR family transcriptional regulator